MTWFCMFYRVLNAQARAGLGASADPAKQQLSLLRRVSAATRAEIVKRIQSAGSQEFTRETVADLESHNPELLIMAHNFATDHSDYGGVIQGKVSEHKAESVLHLRLTTRASVRKTELDATAR